jgi:hypothetical protein
VTETAGQAQARVVGSLIDEIGLLAALAAPSQLEPGQYVKVFGEWSRVLWVDPECRMRLHDLDTDREWTHIPTVGERFVWHEGPW